MCNICEGKLKLISFKWNKDGQIIYVYRCDICGERHEFASEINDEELSYLIGNSNSYKEF